MSSEIGYLIPQGPAALTLGVVANEPLQYGLTGCTCRRLAGYLIHRRQGDSAVIRPAISHRCNTTTLPPWYTKATLHDNVVYMMRAFAPVVAKGIKAVTPESKSLGSSGGRGFFYSKFTFLRSKHQHLLATPDQHLLPQVDLAAGSMEEIDALGQAPNVQVQFAFPGFS